MVSGPVCTQVLGDLGADVLKVEAPPFGDPSRVTGSQVRDGMSGYFAQLNRNKESIVVDLRNEEGPAVARRLVAGADVVVQNFRPGVAERLGIDYESLREVSPTLVYVAITGFGPDGPYAEQPAYDHILQGLTGMMPVQGDAQEPRMMQSVVVDKASGLAAASAAVAALLARERTGQGQRVDAEREDLGVPDVERRPSAGGAAVVRLEAGAALPNELAGEVEKLIEASQEAASPSLTRPL